MFWLVPLLIKIFVFTAYVMLGNKLTAAVAFPVVLMLMSIQYPLRAVPESVTQIVDCLVSVNRMQEFLLTEEIDTTCIKRNDKSLPNVALKIENGNFYWVEATKEKLEASVDLRTNADQKKSNEGYIQMKSSRSEASKKKALKGSKDEDDGIQMSQNIDLESPETIESAKIPTESTLIDEKEEGRTQSYVLKDINLEIQQGSFVAIIGEYSLLH